MSRSVRSLTRTRLASHVCKNARLSQRALERAKRASNKILFDCDKLKPRNSGFDVWNRRQEITVFSFWKIFIKLDNIIIIVLTRYHSQGKICFYNKIIPVLLTDFWFLTFAICYKSFYDKFFTLYQPIKTYQPKLNYLQYLPIYFEIN